MRFSLPSTLRPYWSLLSTLPSMRLPLLTAWMPAPPVATNRLLEPQVLSLTRHEYGTWMPSPLFWLAVQPLTVDSLPSLKPLPVLDTALHALIVQPMPVAMPSVWLVCAEQE